MKKWCAVILLCFLIIIAGNKKENVKSVFKENYLNTYEKNEFILKKIDVSNASITTKNITSFFKNVSLHKVEYEIPKLFQPKFSDNNSYTFQNQSIEECLSKIETIVSSKLKSLGYQKEVERIYFYGVKLLSVEVYGSIAEIEAFEEKINRNQ